MDFSIYEVIMLICFGAAWPFAIAKSWKSRSSKGKSVFFLFVILIGYIAGILNKVTTNRCCDYALALYVLNALMVAADIALYFRNQKYDRPPHDTFKT